MSMLARVPRSRTTKDVDLAALRASDLAEAERALAALAAADLGDHLTFRLLKRQISDAVFTRLRGDARRAPAH
jgi:hypothetical protein